MLAANLRTPHVLVHDEIRLDFIGALIPVESVRVENAALAVLDDCVFDVLHSE